MSAPLLVDQYGRPFDNCAPAFVGRADFTGWKPHELCRVDVEVIPKDEVSDQILEEEYWAPAGRDPVHEPAAFDARRYWAIPGKLMVGGWIRDASERMHLSVAYGITHVLSFDDWHSDDTIVSQKHRAAFPWPVGKVLDELEMRQLRAIQKNWIERLPPEAVVYARGRLGHMRGPCAAYWMLRTRHGLSREDAQRRAGRGPASPAHPWGAPLVVSYINTLDRVIRGPE